MGSTTSKLIIWGAVLAPPGVLAVSGNDFSNNLFSDLAPLLALFGEQVAKQFMSQSMTWLEDIIFAMAPLGIITAMISAIRVGGPNWLKAVVGRARESSAMAEVELLSSTSHEVCELWNGHAIVRVMGSPSIAEILYFEEADMAGDNTCGLYTFEEAKARGVLRDLGLGPVRRQSDLSTAAATATSGATGARTAEASSFELSSAVSHIQGQDPEAPLLDSDGDPNGISAPNVSLNFCEIHNKLELRAFAILGTVLQFGSLVFIAFGRYHPALEWRAENRRFAYPLMATGTIFLVLGMLLCSRTVQDASQETTWGVNKGAFRVLWLQKSDVVNDQVFESYAIFAESPRKKLITSRRRTAETSSKYPKSSWIIKWSLWLLSSEHLAIVGVLTSLVGFVSQFVGLRSLDWSAPISQLVIILIMAAGRTWIRRNMSARPHAESVPRGNEIDWLATQLGMSTANLWNLPEPRDPPPPPAGACNGDSCDGRRWKVSPQTSYLSYEEVIEIAPHNMKAAWKMVRIRERLGYLTKWPGRSYRTASNLSNCIQRILDYITTTNSITRIARFPEYVLQWALPVKVGMEDQYTILTAQRRRDELGKWLGWSVPVSELDAVLSLWLYAIEGREKRDHIANRESNPSNHVNWLQELQLIGGNSKVLRVLGKASDDFRRECRWWMERGGRFVLVRPVGTGGSTCSTQELSRTNLQTSGGRGGDGTGESPTVFEASHRIVGLKAKADEDGSLGIISEMPLESMCAQEVLSAFLWVIAGVVESITGKTSPREAEPGDHESNLEEWFDFKRQNVFLEGLAEIIHSSGIATVQEAYALFIPPLETKLPGKSYIVTECRQRIRRLKVTEGWENTAKAKHALLELFKICKGHPTAITVTAMLTEELCSLHSLETIWKHRSGYDTESHKVTDHVSSIKDKLRNEAEELTLAALKYLYEKQGRGSGGPDCLPEECLDIFPGISPENEEEVKRRANWTPAHQHVLDRSPRDNHLDVNAADILGWTPLHYIANRSGDHYRSFSKVVDAGGQIDARTMLDYTPLHLAASQGNLEIVKRLLELGADKEALNADQRTPFHLAAERGHQRIVKALKSRDANFRARDKFGWAPLHFAAFGSKLEIAKELLNAGTSPDAKENMDMTPLHLAAHSNESAVVELLLRHADHLHSQKDSLGRRPIHLAAIHGSYAAAQRLFEAHADMNKPDRKGRAPLYLAVRGGHRPLVEFLLNSGVHFTHRQRIKDMARDLGHTETLTVLDKYRT